MQTVVVKIGGSLAGQHIHIVSKLINGLKGADIGTVLVHGGGPRISAALTKAGLEMSWHEGQRVTSTEAVSVVHDVLCGQVNHELVAALISRGISAHGMCGAEGLITAQPLPELERTADVSVIDTDRLKGSVRQGNVPVIAPVGADKFGEFCNINADLAASSIASALNADRIVFLTDVEGIYYDWDNKLRLEDVCLEDITYWSGKGAFNAGMVPKVRAVIRALGGGVGSAYVVHGSREEAVLAAGLQKLREPWTTRGGTRILTQRGERGGSSLDITG